MKEDEEVAFSEGHPEQIAKPKTQAASAARTRKRTRKCRKLTKLDVADVIIKKKIANRMELLQHATSLKRNGDTDLYRFCIERSTKTLVEFIGTVWDAENAEHILQRKKLSRMDIFTKALESPCICEGQWLQCALQLLERNSIELEDFSSAVKELLQKGRGKGRNLLLTGPANCGKTFLLNPLTHIFDSFCNPATGSFAWVGVEEKEVIFLNDFRWDKTIITWADLLLLLEGQLVHFPAPKTHYAQDICLEKDTPIFCTSKAPIVYVKNSVVDDRETEMMQVRWHHFQFRYQLRMQDCKEVPSCANCFASLIN